MKRRYTETVSSPDTRGRYWSNDALVFDHYKFEVGRFTKQKGENTVQICNINIIKKIVHYVTRTKLKT
jgi:hypothetical protein